MLQASDRCLTHAWSRLYVPEAVMYVNITMCNDWGGGHGAEHD